MTVLLVVATIWVTAVLSTVLFATFVAAKQADDNKITQWDWYRIGVDNKYCTEYFCDTHDGVPMTEEQMLSWEEGNDDCYFVVLLLEQGDGNDE